VVVADVDSELGEGTAESIRAEGGTAIFVHADVTSDEDVRAMLAAAEESFGGLDILVNNAGGPEAPPYPDAPPEEWTRVLELNLRSVMLATQLAVQAMRKRGGGAVVNISSVAGLGFLPHGVPAYAAAKAGVVRLTAALAPLRDHARIRINCICPDWVDTPASRRTREHMTPEEIAAMPPILAAEEVADAAVELIEDETLAGRVVVLRGGEVPRLIPLEG
jgi:3-oxoacyl-[acyl-carrier protein] reductase